MEIRSLITDRSGQTFDVVYRESDPLEDLEGKVLQGVHAYCFYKDQLVVVYEELKNRWILPGGGIEEGESYEETTVREVLEETNMKVLRQRFIGYQDVYEPEQVIRQTRSVCVVKPYGEFVSDPDGDITEIKLIDPQEYKQFFDWGTIGDRIMNRALEIRDRS